MNKTVFLFTGQGAQYPGMGKSLYDSVPAARKIFAEAECMRPGIIELCFEGRAVELSLTQNTQPCLFVVDCACAAALESAGVKAEAAAGFSLGELAAVAFGGILSFQNAFKLVCERARLMMAAAQEHPGAMTAVLKLDAETVERIAQSYNNVFPVNYNCPGQTVVSGSHDELAAFEEEVAEHRGRCMRLRVSGGFHSPFMSEAAKGLRWYLNSLDFNKPRIPVYSNVTANEYGDASDLISAQIMSPVLWQRTIENLLKDGFTDFIEVGAGKTLSGFMKKIGAARMISNVEDEPSLENTLSLLREVRDA